MQFYLRNFLPKYDRFTLKCPVCGRGFYSFEVCVFREVCVEGEHLPAMKYDEPLGKLASIGGTGLYAFVGTESVAFLVKCGFPLRLTARGTTVLELLQISVGRHWTHNILSTFGTQQFSPASYLEGALADGHENVTLLPSSWMKQQGHLIFVVPSIMFYSSEISPTRCNNCVFILRNGITLHVSGDNLTHHQEYICCIWPQVSRLT